MEQAPLHRAVAEFVGTFALIFIGGGSIVMEAGLVGIALAHGLVIAVMASAVGHISGVHFNPGVTFGFLITRGAFKSIAGLAIGLTITLDIPAGGPITRRCDERHPGTGAGAHPERLDRLLDLRIIGPLVGGGAAALLYDRLYLRPLAPVPPGPPETGLEEPRAGQAAADEPREPLDSTHPTRVSGPTPAEPTYPKVTLSVLSDSGQPQARQVPFGRRRNARYAAHQR